MANPAAWTCLDLPAAGTGTPRCTCLGAAEVHFVRQGHHLLLQLSAAVLRRVARPWHGCRSNRGHVGACLACGPAPPLGAVAWLRSHLLIQIICSWPAWHTTRFAQIRLFSCGLRAGVRDGQGKKLFRCCHAGTAPTAPPAECGVLLAPFSVTWMPTLGPSACSAPACKPQQASGVWEVQVLNKP